MAFSLNFSTCQFENCTKLRITDISTDWASSTIPIGDPNAVVLIVITDSGSNTETWDVSTAFHTATVQSDLVFDSDDYSGGPYSDGHYTIEYSIYPSSPPVTVTYTKTKDQFFICQIDCCISKMVSKIPDYYQCEGCDREYIRNTLILNGLLLALKDKVRFGLWSEAQDIWDVLDSMCDWKNCNCL